MIFRYLIFLNVKLQLSIWLRFSLLSMEVTLSEIFKSGFTWRLLCPWVGVIQLLSTCSTTMKKRRGTEPWRANLLEACLLRPCPSHMASCPALPSWKDFSVVCSVIGLGFSLLLNSQLVSYLTYYEVPCSVMILAIWMVYICLETRLWPVWIHLNSSQTCHVPGSGAIW
jgi:hypothetical protein